MATQNHDSYRLPSETKLISLTNHSDCIEYTIQFVPDRTCPTCRETKTVVKDTSPHTVRHIPYNHIGTFITFPQTRFFCPVCRVSFTPCPPWKDPAVEITNILKEEIIFELAGKSSFHDISTRLCVPEKTIVSVLNAVIIDHPRTLPETLGIDEFSGDVGEWKPELHRWTKIKFLCNISDLSYEHSFIIDVLPSTSLDYLTNFFMNNYSPEQRRAVKRFCCDMNGGFISLARKVFPDASICIDMFHVIKRLNLAITQVRLRVQNSYCQIVDGHRFFQGNHKSDYNFLQRCSRLLVVNESHRPDLTPKMRENLEHCFELSADLGRVYNAVQEFHLLKEKCDFLNLQFQNLLDWIDYYQSSDVPELRDAVRTIEKWKSYIRNAWRYHCSNAACEGLNREIKDIKRFGCGYHSFETFRKRILLSCGSMKILHHIPSSPRRKSRKI